MIRYSISGSSIFLLCLVLGCGVPGGEEAVAVVIRADPTTKTFVETVLKESPEFAIPAMQTKLSIMVVEPTTGVDFKILQVVPDPDVEYRVAFIDSSSGEEITELSQNLGEALRRKLQQQTKP